MDRQHNRSYKRKLAYDLLPDIQHLCHKNLDKDPYIFVLYKLNYYCTRCY